MTGNPSKDRLIPLPNDDSHKCFGCSPSNASGLKMAFYTNKERDSVYSWLTVPGHVCGWGNLVHGGIVTTILDEAMGWASIFILKKLFLTKTMTVNFFKPVFVGQEICAVGRISNVINDREVEVSGAVYDGKDVLCAKSSSTVSLFEVEEIRKAGIFEETQVNGLERILTLFNTI